MNTLHRILDHFRPTVHKHDPGPRNAKGEWRPAYPIEYAPVLVWPPRPVALLKWLVSWPGFMWPRNLVLLGISVAAWYYTQPEEEHTYSKPAPTGK
jgi:hypothetical protein